MTGRPYILVVDNDQQASLRCDLEEAANFQVLYATNVEDALHFARTIPEIRFGVIDVRLPDFAPYTDGQTDYGKRAGLRLLKDLEELLPLAKFLLKTASSDIAQLRNSVSQRASVVPPRVVDGTEPSDKIESRANEIYSGSRPNLWVLLVHGHDPDAISALEGLLLKRYGLRDVHVLRNLPDQGRAIIEKFESFARRADLVFALMTDDDVQANGEEKRTRQNVIFEIGYFCSALQRTSGRLILLEKRGIEIPSDMRGLLTIDITDGVDTPDTRERIDTELKALGISPV